MTGIISDKSDKLNNDDKITKNNDDNKYVNSIDNIITQLKMIKMKVINKIDKVHKDMNDLINTIKIGDLIDKKMMRDKTIDSIDKIINIKNDLRIQQTKFYYEFKNLLYTDGPIFKNISETHDEISIGLNEIMSKMKQNLIITEHNQIEVINRQQTKIYFLINTVDDLSDDNECMKSLLEVIRYIVSINTNRIGNFVEETIIKDNIIDSIDKIINIKSDLRIQQTKYCYDFKSLLYTDGPIFKNISKTHEEISNDLTDIMSKLKQNLIITEHKQIDIINRQQNKIHFLINIVDDLNDDNEQMKKLLEVIRHTISLID
jgi:hypothetical protein